MRGQSFVLVHYGVAVASQVTGMILPWRNVILAAVEGRIVVLH